MKMKILILLSLFFSNSTLLTQEEPKDINGNGFRNISTLEHLRWISENDSSWSWNFELDNDIDASDTRNWNVGDHDDYYKTPDSAMGFKPIGRFIKDSTQIGFSGKFRGRAKTIRNLYINRKLVLENIGFFGFIDSGYVDHIDLSNADIKAYSESGGLCGLNEGQIHRCCISGNFTMAIESGALCGVNSGTITHSSTAGKILANYSNIGGICATNNGEISYCFSNVKLNGSNSIGGFCSKNNGLIEKCYSINIIIGAEFAGGFCFENHGRIKNCYSLTDVYALKGLSGGFCGINYFELINCYSTGQIDGKGRGGFCGYTWTGGGWLHCYWDSENSGINSSNGGEAKTTAEMKTQSTFVSWDFDNIWSINPEINDGYPYLRGTPVVSVEDKIINPINNLISIFPNPAGDYIDVKVAEGLEIEIFNAMGISVGVHNSAPPQVRIDISTLPSGLYFVRIGEKYLKFVKI